MNMMNWGKLWNIRFSVSIPTPRVIRSILYISIGRYNLYPEANLELPYTWMYIYKYSYEYYEHTRDNVLCIYLEIHKIWY